LINWRRLTGLLVAPLCWINSSTAAEAADIALSDLTPRQGETIEVKVSGLEDGTAPGIRFNGDDYKLFPTDGGDTFRALIGVPADLDPGTYKLKVGSETRSLQVRKGLFPLQHLRLPPAKDNFDMSAGEKEAVEGAKAALSPEREWSEHFIRPSKYRTSTLFGVKRVVNGHLLKDYFHSGLDFAAPAGTPVVATAPGKVILTGRGFKLHGNCVAVDHGQGVVSFYIHLKTIDVQRGEKVAAGNKLGTIGQTGRANGPHLHFSIYVNKVATNPMDWFQRAF
jgi:murein DD-endopeptidase MepM/ murein hydrolase activator NlpD